MRIRNDSKALQGVWTDTGLVNIEPGKVATIDVRKDYLPRLRRLPFLVDVDAEAQANKAKAEALADADAKAAKKK